MDATLTELFKHNLWANLRLLDACAVLSDDQLDASAPGTFGRVRDTLVHILGAEEHYVGLLTDRRFEDALGPGSSFPGFEDLRRRAQRSGEALITLAAQVQPAQTLRGTRQGRPYAVAAGIPLVQAINHGTEHRAHVVTTLSGLGIPPTGLDAWAYGEARGLVDFGAST